MLRAKSLGFSIKELDYITCGMVYDCLTESLNDNEEYDYIPTQADFDNF